MRNLTNEIEGDENLSQQNLTVPFRAIRNSLITEREAGLFGGFDQAIAEANRSQENSLAVRLATEGLIIQASEVLHPQSDCLRDLIRSTSTGLRNNPLSMTVMGFLGLNVEVLAGIAAYCNIKFPENAMNGTNITGANITGANILRNTTETRHECMEVNLSYAIPAIIALFTLAMVGRKIIENFEAVREPGGRADQRTQRGTGDQTEAPSNQQAPGSLVAGIVVVGEAGRNNNQGGGGPR